MLTAWIGKIMCKQNKVWSFKSLDFQTYYRRGVVSRWWRNWTGKLPSPVKIHQKITCMWNNSHRTSSEPWERTAGVQKGKPIYLKWGRAKDKDKKGDKGFGDSILRRGSWRRRSFQATGNPLTGGVIGELRNLRWKHNNAKRRKFCTEVVPNGNFQPKSSSHTLICLEQVGAGCGAWSSGKGLGLSAVKILQGDSCDTAQQDKENSGSTRHKVHFCEKALRQRSDSLCTHRTKNSILGNSEQGRAGCSL